MQENYRTFMEPTHRLGGWSRDCVFPRVWDHGMRGKVGKPGWDQIMEALECRYEGFRLCFINLEEAAKVYEQITV